MDDEMVSVKVANCTEKLEEQESTFNFGKSTTRVDEFEKSAVGCVLKKEDEKI